MIHIQKRRTPALIKEKAEEIKKTPDSGYDEIKLPQDSKQLRCLFDQMPKDQIRQALYEEQHELCAYCMKRITPSGSEMKIEHYEALSEDKEKALDYQNYLGVCYGGEKDGDDKVRILCCDAERKDRKLTINPWNRRQIEAIGYYRTGEIFVRQDKGLDQELTDAMQKDIDDILHLNGEKDAEGRIIRDTSSKLIANRRRICDSVHSQFERWDKKHQLTLEYLQEVISKLEKQLEGNGIAEEYIGVRLYLYKRKQEQLRHRSSKVS